MQRVIFATELFCKLPFFEIATRSSVSSVYKMLLKPTFAVVNVTNNCNSRCITCNAWKHQSINELTTLELVKVLGQLRSMGITSVAFAGGEPLLRADLPKIIKSSKLLGFKKICLVSNGFLLNESKAKLLIENGLTDVDISLDGLGKTHEIVRGVREADEKALAAIKTLTKLRDEGHACNISALCSFMEINLYEITQIISFCKSLRISLYLNLLDNAPYFFSGVNLSNIWVKNFEKLDAIVSELHKIKKSSQWLLPQLHLSFEFAKRYYRQPRFFTKSNFHCYSGFNSIYVGPHGELYSGCWALPPIGNLRTEKIENILKSQKYKKRLENMLSVKCPGCTCNYDTNQLYSPLSMLQEIKYSV